MKKNTSFVRNAGEGEQFWFAGGGVFTMKCSNAETNGAFSMWEDHVARGKTTPLHMHPRGDELVYVLDGELRVHIDGAEHIVKSGGLYFIPRGTVHAFIVLSETAHILVLVSPGAGEAFFRSVSDPVTSEADAKRPADLPRLHKGAAENPQHIHVLGPPPF